jgi:phosphatidylglycerol:prolipoprotein diacylglycerol transferase
MWPSINLFGLLTIPLLQIFLLLAFFGGSFVFYRLLHQRAAYNEFEVFDCFLLSLFFGFIFGRATFVGLNFNHFGINFWRWLNFINYPGIAVFIAIFMSSFFFWIFLHRRKITDLELLDYWARVTSFSLIFYNLGLFLDGSGSGYLTDSPFGLTFPHLSTKVHPVQLYSAGFYLIIFFWLGHLENNYRTYSWYKRSRSSARTGFVFITFLFCFSLFSLLMLAFAPPMFKLQGLSLDWIFYLVIFIFALILLLKNVFWRTRHKS